VLILLAGLGVTIFNIDPSIIISFAGAICGFLLCYVIPIALHMQILYGDPSELKKSLLAPADDDLFASFEDANKHATYRDTPEMRAMVSSEIDEKQKLKGETPLWMRIIGYGFIILYAFFVFILQIVDVVNEIKAKFHF
jgi:uncharacterized integral membrane protein